MASAVSPPYLTALAMFTSVTRPCSQASRSVGLYHKSVLIRLHVVREVVLVSVGMKPQIRAAAPDTKAAAVEVPLR